MNNTWLVFSASLTARQQALRVKVWRRLSGLGAMQLKNSLWLLPEREECREQFFWLVQEVEAEGGEAVVLECSGLGNVTDAEAQSLFRRARDADYAALEQEASDISASLAAGPEDEILRRETRAFLRKAQRRLASIRAVDFFPSGRAEVASQALNFLSSMLEGQTEAQPAVCSLPDFACRTWVTRERPYVDRLASFWLVRRRIDAGARIRFLSPDEAVPRGADFVSFDMPGADFTHRGELVTFEVLANDFGIRDAAVRRLMAVVKAIDLAGDAEEAGEDRVSGMPAEARAVKDVLDGLVTISTNDAELLERATLLFDALAATYDTGA
ncbi:MAG: chromate resistance protein [Humidesulfovibrio sp.]|jgi:hypothetical protein|uniref:chromate resistance protein ChrB domain-containing protein n=1 Tax=Humidesulfovibrio sp. TaxID=2910988 RepID=UPI00273354CA|nr:chromate resistance protein ChrB domain-containing protein [Humidesulfovibrio sp.]MDP2847588.1 chromate resistance protein [Humidesulfovibrio sp.]